MESSVSVGVSGDESSLIARLSLEQKVRLLTGADAWVLHGEPAVDLRPMVMSDGPAGVRGVRYDAANPSSSLPCPIALGATWDEDLVEEVTVALGREARARGVDIILAPTINIIRTPVSGRGFECFSEDPVLTSRIAVAYVRGVQQVGVAATAKHFVANDSETERRTYDARVDDGVLRELYLAPFEACVAEAGVLWIMAAYNSVNGATMTANRPLLNGLLKGEWGFSGAVVSDWSAATSTVGSADGGLDLVMPGPDGPWGEKLVAAVRDGRVAESTVDEKVARLLTVARRVGALGGAADGNGSAPAGASGAAPIEPSLLRRVAGRSFVLLKNEAGLLPLPAGRVERVALIGPNAVEPQLQGGGSIRVLPLVRSGLADSLRDAMDAQVVVHQGAQTSSTVALPAPGTVHDPVTGRPGVHLEIRDADGTVYRDGPHPTTVVTWWDGLPEPVIRGIADFEMRARYRPEADGPHVIGAAGVGVLKVSVDGRLVAEAKSLPPRDVVEALSKPPELRVPVQLHAGREVDVRVEFTPETRFVTLRLGIARQRPEEELLDEAAAAAAAADVAVVVVGSAEGTESEGYDREGVTLPGRQDELVRRVAEANPNTVVVVNTGLPVLMPWADHVASILQVWLPGQAFGEALAEVLVGAAEPGGRLPVSISRAESDSPVLRAQPDNGSLAYSEGLLVGYRGFDRSGKEPRFAFGHGLGYTDWQYESIVPAATEVTRGEGLSVTVRVRNSGTRAGREVVQLYVGGPDDDVRRPVRMLAGFAGVTAEAGEQVDAVISIPARAFMRYVEGSGWAVHSGKYTVHAARSSRDLRLRYEVAVR
jgi:beta-glucosidase